MYGSKLLQADAKRDMRINETSKKLQSVTSAHSVVGPSLGSSSKLHVVRAAQSRYGPLEQKQAPVPFHDRYITVRACTWQLPE